MVQMMKDMMVSSLDEHHKRTKSELIDQVIIEMSKMKTDIIQNIDSKVKEAVTEIGNEVQEIRDKCSKQELTLTRHEKDNNYLLDIHRRKNIIVIGLENLNVPRDQNNSNEPAWKEREQKVICLFQKKMKTSFRREDIDYIQNLSKNPSKEILLVRVVSQKIKSEIFSKISELHGSKIFIRDDMSKQDAEIRRKNLVTMRQKKAEGKEAYIRGNKLFVDGVEWSEASKSGAESMQVEEEVEMSVAGSSGSGSSKKTNKRRRTDKEDKNPKKKQPSIFQFLKTENKRLTRSGSESSLVTKIVKEIESGGSQHGDALSEELMGHEGGSQAMVGAQSHMSDVEIFQNDSQVVENNQSFLTLQETQTET